VFFQTRDVRHRGYKEYAGPKFCLDNKLCKSCVNALEIEGVANSMVSVSRLAATLLATASRSRATEPICVSPMVGRFGARARIDSPPVTPENSLRFKKLKVVARAESDWIPHPFDPFLHFIAPPQS